MFNIRSSQFQAAVFMIAALLIGWYFPWILRMAFSLFGRLAITALVGIAAYRILSGRS